MFKYLFYFSLIVPISGFSQHQIKGTFSPATEFKVTMLYHLSSGNVSYTSYGSVNKEGVVQIDLDASIPAGVYKLVYALPQSDHNFEFIYNGTEDVVFNFDRATGVEFINSKENQLFQSYKQTISKAQNEVLQFYTQKTLDSIKYRKHLLQIDSLQNSYETLSKGLIASHFIVASKPYVPSKVVTAETYMESAKSHYFKPMNFQDTILQNSNFLIDKSIDYILGMHPSDTPPFQQYTANIDAVYQAFSNTKQAYQLISLNTLKELLIKSQQEALAVYLTKTYVLPLAIELSATELVLSLQTFLRVAVGAKAPNFEIQDPLTALQTSLYELKDTTTYILIFWSSDCGHCMKELPQVHSYISNHPEKDLKIIAIGLEKKPQPWGEVIKKWPTITHTIAEGKWGHSITKKYDIQATPSYFVLDASKTITSKPYLFKDLKAVLDQK
jgi:thiol-disulfide isomerase/thioredoxin